MRLNTGIDGCVRLLAISTNQVLQGLRGVYLAVVKYCHRIAP